MRIGWHFPAVLLFVSVPAFADAPERSTATIDYLRHLQTKDGGFVPDATKQTPSLRATSAAIRALKYLGGDVPDRAAAERFVLSCHDKSSGGFADSPGGKPDVVVTAVGAMALVELKIPTLEFEKGILDYLGKHAQSIEDIRIAAAGVEALGKAPEAKTRWLEMVEHERNPDGSFGAKNDARTNGGTTVIVLRLGGKLTDPRRVIAALDANQNEDGGFGKKGANSELESTYRVLRCYHMLKAKPKETRALEAFIAKCRNADGGYAVAPGQPSTVGATYYAAIIRHWLKEP
jgi:hypothetical protein